MIQIFLLLKTDQTLVISQWMKKVHGILTVYDMRTRKEIPTKGEMTFKAYKEIKKHDKVFNEDQSKISNEEITNFMKKLKKGTGRYKGKFSLICFNYGKIGHFASKCPYPKQEENENEITLKEQKKSQTKDKRKLYKMKMFYT
jgi:hypothetical protein